MMDTVLSRELYTYVEQNEEMHEGDLIWEGRNRGADIEMLIAWSWWGWREEKKILGYLKKESESVLLSASLCAQGKILQFLCKISRDASKPICFYLQFFLLIEAH